MKTFWNRSIWFYVLTAIAIISLIASWINKEMEDDENSLII